MGAGRQVKPGRFPNRPTNRSTCRQRQLIILGNRVPTVAPDTWIAPNAVVVGDVDLYEKVMQLAQTHTRAHIVAG